MSRLRAVALLASLAAAASVYSAMADTPAEPFSDCEVCPVMVPVPPGEFILGVDASGTMRSGQKRYMGPPRELRISRSFALARTEVTNAQFAAFVAANPDFQASACEAWGGKNRTRGWSWETPGFGRDRPVLEDEPVVCVSWLDAKAYASWLSEMTGEAYRLPTEAEWEYAAQGGAPSDRPWGEDAAALCAHGNVLDQSALVNADVIAGSGTPPEMAAPCDDGFPLVAPVAQFEANGFGLFDMVGNVWEWVEDCSIIPYPERVVSGEPVQAAGQCDFRAVRGGSWRTRASRQSVSWRGRDPETRTYHLFGFRVARDTD